MLEKCERCRMGYTLTNDLICLPNLCDCLHGEPAEGSDCIPDKSIACKVCYQGYHVNGKRDCVPNTCICPKGTPARGAACKSDGSVICTSCKPGWFLDIRKFTCGPKICVCKGGSPVDENVCPSAGMERCAFCFDDYVYEPLLMKCLPVCSCERGTPPRPGLYPCDKLPGIGCDVCFPGFGPTNVTDPVANYTYVDCLPKCTCLDGHPWIGLSPGCLTPGPSCEYCDPGYYLYKKSGTCEPNICWCRHGEPADSESNTCLFNKEQRCLSCEEGWAPANVTAPVHKDAHNTTLPGPVNTTLCFPKCECENGFAANFPQGCNYPKYICHKCYEGFKLEVAKFDPKDPNKDPGPYCIPKCQCKKGKPTLDCDNQQVDSCLSCNFGYELTSKKSCKPACMCAHGTPPRGDACPIPMQMCLSCDPHWQLNPKTIACEPKCTCAHGIAAKPWDNCPKPGWICAKCFKGFSLDKKTKHCNVNRCPCKKNLILDLRGMEYHRVPKWKNFTNVMRPLWHNNTVGLAKEKKLHITVLDVLGEGCPKMGNPMCMVCKVGESLRPLIADWWDKFLKNQTNKVAGGGDGEEGTLGRKRADKNFCPVVSKQLHTIYTSVLN